MFDTINEPVVNLVADDQNIVLLRQLRNLQRIFTAENSAGRIIWKADKNRLCARAYQRLDLFGGYFKIILGLAFDGDRYTAGKNNLGLVRDETWRRNNNLVPLVTNRRK